MIPRKVSVLHIAVYFDKEVIVHELPDLGEYAEEDNGNDFVADILFPKQMDSASSCTVSGYCPYKYPGPETPMAVTPTFPGPSTP